MLEKLRLLFRLYTIRNMVSHGQFVCCFGKKLFFVLVCDRDVRGGVLASVIYHHRFTSMNLHLFQKTHTLQNSSGALTINDDYKF